MRQSETKNCNDSTGGTQFALLDRKLLDAIIRVSGVELRQWRGHLHRRKFHLISVQWCWSSDALNPLLPRFNAFVAVCYRTCPRIRTSRLFCITFEKNAAKTFINERESLFVNFTLFAAITWRSTVTGDFERGKRILELVCCALEHDRICEYRNTHVDGKMRSCELTYQQQRAHPNLNENGEKRHETNGEAKNT